MLESFDTKFIRIVFRASVSLIYITIWRVFFRLCSSSSTQIAVSLIVVWHENRGLSGFEKKKKTSITVVVTARNLPSKLVSFSRESYLPVCRLSSRFALSE